MNALETIANKIHDCTLCPLHNTRKNAVPGEGPDKVSLMFIGEAPGRVEDEQGRPFIGKSGKVLDKYLQLVGIDRRKVFITSIVKCRPPNNRTPHHNEIQLCVTNYLSHQIDCLQPSVICLLGGVAIHAMLGVKKVEQARGKVIRGEQVYFATYHPAAAGRNRLWEKALYEDMCLLKKLAF